MTFFEIIGMGFVAGFAFIFGAVIAWTIIKFIGDWFNWWLP
jgi:hypothetical protein